MKIYLDADGSPITSELINLAREYNVELIIVKNYLTNIKANMQLLLVLTYLLTLQIYILQTTLNTKT